MIASGNVHVLVCVVSVWFVNVLYASSYAKSFLTWNALADARIGKGRVPIFFSNCILKLQISKDLLNQRQRHKEFA